MTTMTLELYEAAESGNVAALEELQERKIDVLVQVSPGGNTALHISAYYGHQSFVEKLLQLINAKSDVEARNEEQKRRFLRAKNNEDNNALHETVRGGDHGNIVEELINADPDLARSRNRKGESPLFTASANGRLNAVQNLLQLGDPLYARFDGQTCLHHALYYEHYEVAAALLKQNSELSKQEDYFSGNTPLHIAAFRGCPENVIKKLLERDPDTCYKTDKIKQQTALHVAADHGHVAVVKCILMFARSCVEITDKDGRTALHYAVENGHVGVVRALIPSMERLLDMVDNNGGTALDILLHNFDRVEQPIRYYRIRRLLRRNRAKVEVETANKRKETRPFRNGDGDSTNINNLLVCATLIATVTFQAAFTLPGGTETVEGGRNITWPGGTQPSEDDKNIIFSPQFPLGKKRVSVTLSRDTTFASFIVLDTLAFSLSMMVAILLAYEHTKGRNFIVYARFLLPVALYMTMATFASTIFSVLKHDSLELALIGLFVPMTASALILSRIFYALIIDTLNRVSVGGDHRGKSRGWLRA